MPGLRAIILDLLATIESVFKNPDQCADETLRLKASQVFEEQQLVARVKNLILELTLVARGFTKQPRRATLDVGMRYLI